MARTLPSWTEITAKILVWSFTTTTHAVHLDPRFINKALSGSDNPKNVTLQHANRKNATADSCRETSWAGYLNEI